MKLKKLSILKSVLVLTFSMSTFLAFNQNNIKAMEQEKTSQTNITAQENEDLAAEEPLTSTDNTPNEEVKNINKNKEDKNIKEENNEEKEELQEKLYEKYDNLKKTMDQFLNNVLRKEIIYKFNDIKDLDLKYDQFAPFNKFGNAFYEYFSIIFNLEKEADNIIKNIAEEEYKPYWDFTFSGYRISNFKIKKDVSIKNLQDAMGKLNNLKEKIELIKEEVKPIIEDFNQQLKKFNIIENNLEFNEEDLKEEKKELEGVLNVKYENIKSRINYCYNSMRIEILRKINSLKNLDLEYNPFEKFSDVFYEYKKDLNYLEERADNIIENIAEKDYEPNSAVIDTRYYKHLNFKIQKNESFNKLLNVAEDLNYLKEEIKFIKEKVEKITKNFKKEFKEFRTKIEKNIDLKNQNK